MTQDELLDELQVGTENEFVANRFSGEEVELEPLAVALYDFIMGAEAMGDFKMMQKGLDIFRKKYPRAYMVLLD